MPLDCDESLAWKLDSESDPDHIAEEDEDELMSVAPGEVDREEGAEEGWMRTRIFPLSEGDASKDMSKLPRPSNSATSAPVSSSFRGPSIRALAVDFADQS